MIVKSKLASATALAILVLCAIVAPASAQSLEVESVVLRLIEEAEVPAQEAGVVTNVAVREGQHVKRGELLAQIDDQVARLAAEAAKAEYDIAHGKAANDVKIRFAQKALEVSEAELKRSQESIERFAKSVSQSQLDVERLTVERNKLESEQATHDQEIAKLDTNAREKDLKAAVAAVSRRRILAPFDGVIVQMYVRLGEWVEPGQKAFRIVNVDRLKAEGFIKAEVATDKLLEKPVKLTVDLGGTTATMEGKIVFVSPEVDSITGQVRVWAEIENKDGALRPGQPAKMRIGP